MNTPPTMNDFLLAVRLEFPDYKLVPKAQSGFMKFLNVLLLIVTFGKVKDFMDNFTTTVGMTSYTPKVWDQISDAEKIVILRHERVHLRQQKKYGKLKFKLMYLFCPLPFFVLTWRARFEMEAYAESMVASHDFGIDIQDPGYREWMIEHFTTAEYAWMCTERSRVEVWFNDVIRDIFQPGS